MKILSILLCFFCLACEQELDRPHANKGDEVEPQSVLSVQSSESREIVRDSNNNRMIGDAASQVHVVSADALGLQILSNQGNSEEALMPQLSQESDVGAQQDDFSVDRLQIIVHRKLFLADPEAQQIERRKEYFFVWPEQALGSRITHGRYSHRTRTMQDTWIGTLNPHPIWHDVENHRWFVPLADIFRNLPEYGPLEVKMDHSQVLTLELSLENGNTVIIEIVFQAVGPFPHFQLISVPRIDPVHGQDFSTQVARHGWVIHQETLHNPSTRAFHLWMKSNQSIQNLKFKTHLKSSTYTNQRESPPLGPFWHYYVSTGDVAVSEVELISPTRPMEIQPVQTHSWLQVVLQPGEVLNVKWKVKPLLTTQRCVVPLGMTQTYHWTVPYPLAPLRSLFPQELQALSVPHSISYLKPWSITGGSLQGDWGREIRLTHDFVTPEEATQVRRDGQIDQLPPYLLLTENSASTADHRTVQVHAGEVEGTRMRFNCQGVFP